MKKNGFLSVMAAAALLTFTALSLAGCSNGNGDGGGTPAGGKTLVSIAVTTQPTKTQYNINEELNTAGMVVTATYSDNSTAAVTGYTTSGYDKTKTGSQTVTVTYQGKTAAFTVNVIDPSKETAATPTATPAAGEVADNTAITLATATAGAVIYYTQDGTEPGITSALYSDSDKPVITTGKTTLKAIAVKDGMNNSKTLTADYTISTSTAPVTGVTLNKTSISLIVGETETLTATVSPADAADKAVTWTSSDDEVVTVSAGGLVTPVKSGTATITVTTTDGGKTAECTVTVYPADMARIPGGSFEMGKDLGTAATGDETPVHTVTLTGFYMGKYQVTQAQYEAVMGELPSSLPGSAYGVGDNHPVYYVSWYDAIEFCNALSIQEGLSPYYSIDKVNQDPNNTNSYDTYKWTVTLNSSATGYRLPTEAQWEYAAKGGDGTPGDYTYSGSDDLNEVGWYSGNNGSSGTSAYGSKAVGTKAPNGLGIYDMSGNVFEWCWDWYDDYTSGAQTDPAGAAFGSARVLRGGGWYSRASNARSVYRSNYYPYNRIYGIGFRLVRP